MTTDVDEAVGHLQHFADTGRPVGGIPQIRADLRAALAEIDRRGEEIERLRDENADSNNSMLRRFDPPAVGHTDLYTWIDCLVAERNRLRAEHEALKAREAALRRRVAESPRAWQHRMSGTVFQSRDGLDATLCDPVRIVLWHDDGGALETDDC